MSGKASASSSGYSKVADATATTIFLQENIKEEPVIKYEEIEEVSTSTMDEHHSSAANSNTIGCEAVQNNTAFNSSSSQTSVPLTSKRDMEHPGKDKSSTCFHCSRKLSNAESLQAHIVHNHNTAGDRRLCCLFCSTVASGENCALEMEMHVLTTHGLATYKCKLCTFFTFTVGEFLEHIDEYHAIGNEIITISKFLWCIERPLCLCLMNEYHTYSTQFRNFVESTLNMPLDSSKINSLIKYRHVQEKVTLCASPSCCGEAKNNDTNHGCLQGNLRAAAQSENDAHVVLYNETDTENFEETYRTIFEESNINFTEESSLNRDDFEESNSIHLEDFVAHTVEESNKRISLNNFDSLGSKDSRKLISSNPKSRKLIFVENMKNRKCDADIPEEKSSQEFTSSKDTNVIYGSGASSANINNGKVVSLYSNNIEESYLKDLNKNSENSMMNENRREGNGSCFQSNCNKSRKKRRKLVEPEEEDGKHRTAAATGYGVVTQKQLPKGTWVPKYTGEQSKDPLADDVLDTYINEGPRNTGRLRAPHGAASATTASSILRFEAASPTASLEEPNTSPEEPNASPADAAAPDSSFIRLGMSDWPKVFDISEKKMSSKLKHALRSQETLPKEMRRGLMEHLYETITQYTFFPRRAQYQEVIQALFLKYPHLWNGMVFEVAFEYWRSKLSEKFRNTRKRRDREIPCVIASRERFAILRSSSHSPGSGTEQKSTPASGMKNYLPKEPASEDDASTEQHRLLLVEEHKKKKWDLRAVDSSMQFTFYDRRCRVVREGHLLARLKCDYPCLFDSHQLCCEFQRISEVNISSALEEALLVQGPAIIALAGHIHSCHQDESAIESKEFIIAKAISLLPELLNEKLDFTAVPEEESAPAMRLQTAPSEMLVQGEIVAGNMVLCTTSTALEALCCWFATYAIFNIAYPKRWKNTLIFLQKILLNISDSLKTPAMVTNTSFKINEELRK